MCLNVRVISKKKLRDFYTQFTQAEVPLTKWYYKMKIAEPKNLTELRLIFNSVDPVYGYTVFNIGGNNFRLITAMHYNTHCCYIRNIWTHTEYSKRYNQDKLKRGEL
jgi:mRNA interferase HigB